MVKINGYTFSKKKKKPKIIMRENTNIFNHFFSYEFLTLTFKKTKCYFFLNKFRNKIILNFQEIKYILDNFGEK